MSIQLSLFLFLVLFAFTSQLESKVDFAIIDQYIEELMTESTAEIPVWNIEKAKAGKKSGWDYIDGCMIMALLEFYSTTKEPK